MKPAAPIFNHLHAALIYLSVAFIFIGGAPDGDGLVALIRQVGCLIFGLGFAGAAVLHLWRYVRA